MMGNADHSVGSLALRAIEPYDRALIILKACRSSSGNNQGNSKSLVRLTSQLRNPSSCLPHGLEPIERVAGANTESQQRRRHTFLEKMLVVRSALYPGGSSA